MIRAILAVIVAALIVAFAWWLAGLPGQVAADIAGTTIETSLPVGILLLAILFLLLYLVIRIVAGLIGLPARMRRWNAARRRQQGDQAVTRTLIALAAGDTADARREAGRARRLLGDTPHTLLLAAESARRMDRTDEAENAFRQLAERDDARFLGLRGLLRQAEARGDWAAAAELARQAEEAHPGSDWLRAERTRLALRAGNWREALTLAPRKGNNAALTTAAAQAEPDPDAARKLARQAFEAEPGLAPAALTYAKLLRDAGRESRAQDVIRRAWAARPQPDLAQFALATAPDNLARMQTAQRLAQENPQHAETHLMLAETALEANLPGEARRHADAARAAGLNQRRLWTLLAAIAEKEGSASAQHEALRNAARAQPDPAWHCTNCGAAHAHWHPICQSCHHPGTLEWTPAAPMLELE
jgi:HemY protein